MPDPIILSTWSFGQRANSAAWPGLLAGGGALDAVETACRDAEADLNNHTVGVGGFPDRGGQVSLDASIMLSPSQCGAVGAVRCFAHPISIARAVMERTPHVMLVGDGADQFAREQRFMPSDLLTPEAKAAWEKWRQSSVPQAPAAILPNVEERLLGQRSIEPSHDTIGILALDAHGTLAGACSTSGLSFKVPGRVGDSPIIGHALYVDPGVGAAVATGHGELVMGLCGSFLAVESMRRGATPLDAGLEVIRRIAAAYQLRPQDQTALIVMNRAGEWRGVSLRPGFRVAVRTISRDELVEPDHVLLP